jgi:hypothetical protein
VSAAPRPQPQALTPGSETGCMKSTEVQTEVEIEVIEIEVEIGWR